MKINEITLRNVLPHAFRDSESGGQIVGTSQVWLVDLVLRRGEYYMIEASSGMGKSSLCSYIYGSRNDYDGVIAFDGRDIREFGIEEWCRVRRSSLALLPQDMMLFPELTAWENVEVKNSLTHCLQDDEIRDLFELFGIADRISTPVARMSVGQQQRVAIIRTLCQAADFFILDEPVSHLDEQNNRIVADTILAYARRQDAGIISTSVGNPLMLSAPLTHIKL